MSSTSRTRRERPGRSRRDQPSLSSDADVLQLFHNAHRHIMKAETPNSMHRERNLLALLHLALRFYSERMAASGRQYVGKSAALSSDEYKFRVLHHYFQIEHDRKVRIEAAHQVQAVILNSEYDVPEVQSLRLPLHDVYAVQCWVADQATVQEGVRAIINSDAGAQRGTRKGSRVLLLHKSVFVRAVGTAALGRDPSERARKVAYDLQLYRCLLSLDKFAKSARTNFSLESRSGELLQRPVGDVAAAEDPAAYLQYSSSEGSDFSGVASPSASTPSLEYPTTTQEEEGGGDMPELIEPAQAHQPSLGFEDEDDVLMAEHGSAIDRLRHALLDHTRQVTYFDATVQSAANLFKSGLAALVPTLPDGHMTQEQRQRYDEYLSSAPLDEHRLQPLVDAITGLCVDAVLSALAQVKPATFVVVDAGGVPARLDPADDDGFLGSESSTSSEQVRSESSGSSQGLRTPESRASDDSYREAALERSPVERFARQDTPVAKSLRRRLSAASTAHHLTVVLMDVIHACDTVLQAISHQPVREIDVRQAKQSLDVLTRSFVARSSARPHTVEHVYCLEYNYLRTLTFGLNIVLRVEQDIQAMDMLGSASNSYAVNALEFGFNSGLEMAAISAYCYALRAYAAFARHLRGLAQSMTTANDANLRLGTDVVRTIMLGVARLRELYTTMEDMKRQLGQNEYGQSIFGYFKQDVQPENLDTEHVLAFATAGSDSGGLYEPPTLGYLPAITPMRSQRPRGDFVEF